ncbi:MAG: hypothetical protein JRI96_07830 [Deltaproteobacteria bacterium]|nr:hypothetical protein [Deltaproteobacteria bacterium]
MGSAKIYFGTSTQEPNSTLGSLLSDGSPNPAYKNLCYVVFNDCLIGDYNRAPAMRFVIRKCPTYPWSDKETIEQYYYNPAHAIYYILTELAGIDGDYVNEHSFSVAADTLFDENRGVMILFDKQEDALRYVETILQHVDGILFWGVDGRLHLKLVRDDVSTDDMLTVDEDMMAGDFTFDRRSWLDTQNEVKVQYPLMLFGEEACGESVDTGSAGAGETPSFVLVTCEAHYGKYTVSGGYPPYTVQIKEGSEDWKDSFETNGNTFAALCYETVCSSEDEVNRLIRVRDSHDSYSNELSIPKTQKETMVWGGDESVSQGSSVVATVLSGAKPYKWTVSDSYCWFDEQYSVKEITTAFPQATIYVDTGGCGRVVTVTVEDACGQIVTGSVIVSDVALEWDYYDSCETIGRNDNCLVFVTGGTPPFIWSVEGTGFSLDNSKTTERFNTLKTDDSACGAATIKVIDSCGSEVTESVRCTEGSGWIYHGWDHAETGDCLKCGDTDHPVSREIIQGNERWVLQSRADHYHDQCSQAACTDNDWQYKNWPLPPCGTPWECWDRPNHICPDCGFDPPHYNFYDRYNYYTWGCT